MKKIYTLFAALFAVISLHATTYHLVGEFNSWNADAAPQFTALTEGTSYTITVADFFGEFKVIEDNAWTMQYAGHNAGDSLLIGDTYALKAKNESGEPANLRVGKANFGYKNATLTLTKNGDIFSLTFVSGEEYDRAALPDTYQIIGGFTGNWSTADAIEFEDVNGTLTAIVPNLNGSFKIIKNRGWAEQWATNWTTPTGLAFNQPYTLGAKNDNGEPANLTLANPFATYDSAVLTLQILDNGDLVLTLVDGVFQAMQANWYLPGTKLGWECKTAQQFTPVEGQENTYELLAAEFGADFKVVYGEWGVEFGATDSATWTINEPYTCTLKGSNIMPSSETIYTDCTITLVVDYENVSATITISSELPEALEQTTLPSQVLKRIENGQLVIIKNGIRYNALGAAL